MSRPIPHELAQEQLLDLAYGELPKGAARDLEAHLAGCAACAAELARIRETRAAMSALPAEPAPEGGDRILLAAAREAIAARRRPARLLPPWVWGFSVAAVGVLAVAAISYRVAVVEPLARRDDPEALLGSPVRVDEAKRERAAASPAMAAAPAPANAGPQAAPVPPPPRELRRAEAPAAPAVAAPGPAEAGLAESAPPPAASARKAAPADAFADASSDRAERPMAKASRAIAPASPSAEAEARSNLSGAAPAPAPARTAAPAPAIAAAPAAAGPLARFEALRDAGALRGAFATFVDCPGERSRTVDTGPDGAVVRYVRRGAGFEVEHYFDPEGALALVRWRPPGATWREAAVPTGGTVPPFVPDAAGSPRRAAEAGADAPPRCTP